MDQKTISQAAQIVGLATGLASGGFYYCSSRLIFPQLYKLSTQDVTPIFKAIYINGGKIIVPIVLSSAVSMGIAGYLETRSKDKSALWYTAAATTAMSLPFTLAVLAPTNARLCQIADSKALMETVSRKEVVDLLQTWCKYNYVRAGLSIVGGGMALIAALT